jgi:hypothetical protein
VSCLFPGWHSGPARHTQPARARAAAAAPAAGRAAVSTCAPARRPMQASRRRRRRRSQPGDRESGRPQRVSATRLVTRLGITYVQAEGYAALRRSCSASKGGVSGIHPKTFAQVHKARAKAGVRCVGPSTPALARAGPHGPAPACPRGARARTARLRLRARMRVRGRRVSSASVQSSWPRQRRGRPALLRPPSAERRRSGIPRPASERGSRPIRGAAR